MSIIGQHEVNPAAMRPTTSTDLAEDLADHLTTTRHDAIGDTTLDGERASERSERQGES
eukprot:m.431438 g.431438  ORF g.431438 m.431438 type:complete len:59 (-) comp84374_c0_seq1:419-595(-)